MIAGPEQNIGEEGSNLARRKVADNFGAVSRGYLRLRESQPTRAARVCPTGKPTAERRGSFCLLVFLCFLLLMRLSLIKSVISSTKTVYLIRRWRHEAEEAGRKT
jgi:hypothetical protein